MMLIFKSSKVVLLPDGGEFRLKILAERASLVVRIKFPPEMKEIMSLSSKLSLSSPDSREMMSLLFVLSGSFSIL